MHIKLSLQSLAHFANLIFQKCSECDSFLTFWSAHRAVATVCCSFCRPNLPKVFRTWQFFNILKCTSSSRYSTALILPTQSSKSAVFEHFEVHRAVATVWCTFCRPNLPKMFRMWQFLTFWSAHRALGIQSGAHFADPIFQKCSECDSFLTFWSASSCRYSLVHIFPT